LTVATYGIARYVRNLLMAMAQLQPRPELTLFYAGRRRVRQFEEVWPARWIRIPTRLLETTSVRGPLPIDGLVGPSRLVHAPDSIGVRSLAPLVLTVHDLVVFRMPQLFPALYTAARDPRLSADQAGARAAITRADHIICISETTRRDLLELFDVDPARVSVVYYGAPEPPPGYRRQPMGDGRVRVLFMGRVQHRKNLPTAAAAVSIMRKQGIDAELIVCGDSHGHDSAAIRSTCERLGDGWIHWRGFVDSDDVWDEYARADVLIYPSWYEGFGLPPFEAFKAQVPVVAAGVASLSELLDGAALLCNPASAQEFAAALARVVSDAGEHDRLVKAGQVRAAQYTWERAARETVAVYERFA
jgi:glycosyltransferase involved in cell wall biosynthesis